MDSQIPPQTPSEPTPAQPSSPAPQGPPPPQQPPPRPPGPPWPPAYYFPPQPPRRSPWLLGCTIASVGCLFLVLLLLAIGLFGVVGMLGGAGELEPSGAEIALIRIEGIIVAGPSTYSFFGGQVTGSEQVVRSIERARKDRGIKAVVLRVNSPGGSAAGSQEIYNAIQSARADGLTIVVSMADVAASGGYYVAAPANKIYADPATVTGSIGVIAMHEDMSGLFGKIGVKTETIKSGELKDMFSPYAPLTDDARAVMKTLVMQVYDQFVKAVSEGRHMPVQEVKALADGRIYSGQQALANGLVDELGGMKEALQGAAAISGAKSTSYKEYGVPTLLKLLLGGETRTRGSVLQTRLPEGLLYDDFAARLAWGESAPASPDRPENKAPLVSP